MGKYRIFFLLLMMLFFIADAFSVPKGNPPRGKGPDKGKAPSVRPPEKRPPVKKNVRKPGKSSNKFRSGLSSSNKTVKNIEENNSPLINNINKNEDSIILNYRGSRTLSGKGAFKFQGVKTSFSKEKEIFLEVSFSQEINPRSISRDSILIDGKVLPEEIKISFNKKGDKIIFSVPDNKNDFSLKIQNIESFEGIKIEPVEVKNIHIEQEE